MITPPPDLSSRHKAETDAGCSPRQRILFNDNWQFCLGNPTTPDAGAWRTLDLPHDWGVESDFDISLPGETGKLRWWGEAWYRKTLRLESGDEHRLVSLEIEGAMSNATVWINGRRAGGWAYGYTSFHVDLTPYLIFNDNTDGKHGAENLIEIHLDNPPDSSRWYPGGGLYRNVWLHKTERIHVEANSLIVATRELATDHSGASLEVSCELTNTTSGNRVVRITTHLREAGGGGGGGGGGTEDAREWIAKTEPFYVELLAGATIAHVATIGVAYPKLWYAWTERPSGLYIAETFLEDALTGAPLDHTETTFGIRTARFDSRTGLHLNNSAAPTRIQGACLHHDLGPLGAAAHPGAMARQLTLLRELGCNAIRCAHNPPAPALLDLCDRMGFLVMDELCDTWRIAKKTNGYQTLFDTWVERDLRAMVRRDRHHPSVILWSIGNEIPEQTSPDGPALAIRLADIVRAHDPQRRPVTGGMNIPESGFNGWQRAYDVFGYNYKPGLYTAFREQNPAIPLLGSETASTVSTRGEYAFPVTDDPTGGILAPPLCQISSYDLYTPHWATTPDAEFAAQDAHSPALAGEFVWTGFDYLGEPTPFNDAPTGQPLPARSSYFGIFDLCGFPKDRYYLYQARWRPHHPMAHILPHWDWPERIGQKTPVHVYTSGDAAELFLNGRSLGLRRRGPADYRLRWDHVIYEPGELRVIVRKNNRPWAEARRRTTGLAARIELQANYFPSAGATRNAAATLAFVTARITDADGQLSPRAKHPLHFELSPPANRPPPPPLHPFASSPPTTATPRALSDLPRPIAPPSTVWPWPSSNSPHRAHCPFQRMPGR